ncbi:MAG: DUF2842 domain-containing protein [Hyphomonadaceae bacterium]
MNVRQRKAVGCAALLVYLVVYIGIVAAIGAAAAPSLPPWTQLVFYAFAGIVWIFPLKPLFAWMNRSQ